jgi:2-oxo-4-hydroxy-4-carboxy-5-ureidoimidazoline decarboxylase
MTINSILEDWNLLEPAAAVAAVLPCNGSLEWAAQLAKLRPMASDEALFAAADRVWLALGRQDLQEAFDSHPRIGEHKAKAATEKSLTWSAGEQSAAKLTEETQAALAAANRVYEETFGRIFIVCASGKSADEMLAILRKRLANDAEAELLETAEQQSQITQLRLRKWLAAPQEAK